MAERSGLMRTSGDSWDVAQGVGETALAMAAARAYETTRAEPLFTDDCAAMFVDAAQAAGWRSPFVAPAAASQSDDRVGAMLDYAACRTRYFDDFFTEADDGVQQFVILGAGLDARAWRLRWPTGAVVYEIDQPSVLDFKTSVLTTRGHIPACGYRPVGIDLRQDWPAALRAAGFDPDRPSAWSVEGLLAYLPPDGQDTLFECIQSLSVAGSRIAVEADTAVALEPPAAADRRVELSTIKQSAAQAGNTFLRDVSSLWFKGARPYLGSWLVEHGWSVHARTAAGLMESFGRPAPSQSVRVLPRSEFIAGRRQ
ncbi:SAM-dependent methyltransferase [Mycobacterium sp. OTB74]|uniref:SAM-dependent methyltransferase n=1 Tax=Mycobacterium sp. OTB74 TaxID=1853452 RepID=UPI002473A058|nr:SAM-dependent methyltransferase [Mycobacterium sp. OTB74]MDH6246519.1 methyltransferase (TIGR00027 family) [Mycobacterium sp. OTB74]